MNDTPSSSSRALALLPDGPVELLFLLLHGAGADAAQMRPLAQVLRQQYPQAAVLSLNAPQPFDAIPGGGTGQQWYSLRGDAQQQADSLSAAVPELVATVRSWTAHFQLDWPRVALAGFSQGATLALEAVQAEAELAGRVLAFGGGYTFWPQHAPQQVCLHLLGGMADDQQPYQALVDAARQLMELGADVTADMLPKLGHELHPDLLERAMHQLRTFVPARLWREAVLSAAETPAKPA